MKQREQSWSERGGRGTKMKVARKQRRRKKNLKMEERKKREEMSGSRV